MTKPVDRAEMVVRMPRVVKDWIEREAARTGASQNSEIIRSLLERKERLEREQPRSAIA